MKGFVPTPEPVVDLMVGKLFNGLRPTAQSRVLDPGCGRGAFIDGIIRWTTTRNIPLPQIIGIESDPLHVQFLRARFAGFASVEIRDGNFLRGSEERFDYIIGNPPYVPITSLTEVEKAEYRRNYQTAIGRFDLYLLFFEQALRQLLANGRLVFITPEKYLYVETASTLRKLLAEKGVAELHFLDEETFADLVTYPLVTTVTGNHSLASTSIIERDGVRRVIPSTSQNSSWLPLIRQAPQSTSHGRLADIAARISCGVATGADSIFIARNSDLSEELRVFARPSLAGRDIVSSKLPKPERSVLLPYDAHGTLLPEAELGALGEYLSEPARRTKLLERTCVSYKPWYAFHETPPLHDILRPKILCKDIGARPLFVVDREGHIVPRHSIYYIVPRDSARIDELADYLSSDKAAHWLRDHCQRAANGFLRLQSHVLKQLPLPTSLEWLAPQIQVTSPEANRRLA